MRPLLIVCAALCLGLLSACDAGEGETTAALPDGGSGDTSGGGVPVVDSLVGVYSISSYGVQEDGCDGPYTSNERWTHLSVVEKTTLPAGYTFFVCVDEATCEGASDATCTNPFLAGDDDPCVSWGTGVMTQADGSWSNEVQAWSPGAEVCNLTTNLWTMTQVGEALRLEYRQSSAELAIPEAECIIDAYETYASDFVCKANEVIETGM